MYFSDDFIVLQFCTVSNKNMAPCRLAYTLSELTVYHAAQNMRCWIIQTVMTVRLCVAKVCRSAIHRFTALWFPILSIVHGVLRRAHMNDCWWHDPEQYFFICCMLVLRWDPVACSASLFCAGNALPVNAYFRCGGVRSVHSRQILLTCAQVFPLHCPVHALQWACVSTVRAWRCAGSDANYMSPTLTERDWETVWACLY